jgi:hypothetical protein
MRFLDAIGMVIGLVGIVVIGMLIAIAVMSY